jgi:hypothetical protein
MLRAMFVFGESDLIRITSSNKTQKQSLSVAAAFERTAISKSILLAITICQRKTAARFIIDTRKTRGFPILSKIWYFAKLC